MQLAQLITRRLRRLLPAAFFCLVLAGCSDVPREGSLFYLQDYPQPAPIVDLPKEMRIKNWVGIDQDGDRGGSCVHASLINSFRAAARYDLEWLWFDNRGRGYEGPETASRILAKLSQQQIPFEHTSSGDISVLEWESRTNRMAAIFYYPSHCVNFCGFAVIDGREVAILLDNNFLDRYIVIDRSTFERAWRYYGGFAVVPKIEPMVPRTFPRTIPKTQVM